MKKRPPSPPPKEEAGELRDKEDWGERGRPLNRREVRSIRSGYFCRSVQRFWIKGIRRMDIELSSPEFVAGDIGHSRGEGVGPRAGKMRE